MGYVGSTEQVVRITCRPSCSAVGYRDHQVNLEQGPLWLVSLQLIVVPGSIWNALIAMFASAEERYSRLMFRLVRLKEDSALR